MDERRQGMEDMRSDIKKILYILNGNGEPGLVAKVESHDTQIKSWLKFNSFLLTTFIGTIIVGVVGFVLLKIGIKGQEFYV